MRRRVCVVAVLAIATVALLAGPAAARETTFSETCPDVFGKAATGDLEKKTDPVPDSMVAAGQTVTVTLRWPNTVVAGDREHRIIECATTNGATPWLWAERRLVTGEGTASVSMTVPSGLAAGSKLCSQSILVTKGSFGPVRRWSETTCYRVRAVEKRVMEPLMRRDRETTTTTTEDKGRAEEEKRKKEEEEKRRKEEEERKRKVTTTTAAPTTTTKTEVTLPPTTVSPSPAPTSTTAPAPVVAAVPPRAPQAVPSPPPPKAPITQPAAQAPSRPKGAVAQPAEQLARTGTGALGLFILGGVTLVTGRLLRRVASRNSQRPGRGTSPGSLIAELAPPDQPAPGFEEPANENEAAPAE